jgi:MFS transporter, PAT family, beta-lactamase induction signal transducer AmpG
MTGKISSWQAVWLAMRSWRTASVSLLSFSSGLPLGLVWIAIPTWLARADVDIKVIGLFTLAQAPWSFKFLWSPLLDRYSLPALPLGRKLGWTLFWQIGLLIATLLLGGVATHPDAIWIIGALTFAIAFASASQDIVVDAYAVEVLRPEEQGVAVGARTAFYRAAMFVSGGAAITLAGLWSWPVVFVLIALLYLPFMLITVLAPRPELDQTSAPMSLRAAVWEPFVSFLTKARALEILAFVVLYKLADNLAGALVRPFLVQIGFNDFDVGIATATIGLFATLLGTLLGGVLTTSMGLGHALWVFGILQIVSNLGYVLIADIGVHRPLMYGAMAFESLTSGMGTGAFGVLLLRMTQKQFSATQYALFSSLFALPRILAGPVTGVTVAVIGWHDFFILTMLIGIPGMIMLQRFSPLGIRNPDIETLADTHGHSVSRGLLLTRAAVGGLAGMLVAATVVVLLDILKHARLAPNAGLDLWTPLARILAPHTVNDWLALAGILVFGALMALTTAATAAARARRP